MADRFLFMMSRIHNRILRHVKGELAKQGLTFSPGQMAVLLALEHHAGHEGLPMGDLSRILDMDGAAATRLTDRLEAMGLARRQINEDNRRQVLARLTDEGRAQARAVKRIAQETNRKIGEGFSAGEMAAYKKVSQAILDRF